MAGELSTSDNFIPGVYNYCDRWCDNCSLTDRCYAYASQMNKEPENKHSSDFFKEVTETLTESMVLLEKIVVEAGVDINKELNADELLSKVKSNHMKDFSRNHKIALLSRDYWQKSKGFFDNLENITNDAKRLAGEVIMGLKTVTQAEVLAKEITGSINIIQWYMFFVEAKLQRAIHSRCKGEEYADEILKEAARDDSNGSAKIALIAIDKSLGAWNKLYKLMPGAEDVALICLSLLTQIRKMSLAEFPDAMGFKRPGFD